MIVDATFRDQSVFNCCKRLLVFGMDCFLFKCVLQMFHLLLTKSRFYHELKSCCYFFNNNLVIFGHLDYFAD